MKIAAHIKLPSELIEYRTICIEICGKKINMFLRGEGARLMTTDVSVRKFLDEHGLLTVYANAYDVVVTGDEIIFNSRDAIIHFLNDLISQDIEITQDEVKVIKYL